MAEWASEQGDWAYDKLCLAVPVMRTHPKLLTALATTAAAAAGYTYVRFVESWQRTCALHLLTYLLPLSASWQ